MSGVSNWKLAGSVIIGGLALGSAITLGVVTYWKLEDPRPLPAVKEPKFANIMEHSPLVIDVPAREYAYLGPFVFSTRTVDLKGNVVWSTQWMNYNPGVGYKFVTPDGLKPGMFSVLLTIDYQMNPMSRAEGEVKFLDLVVNKEKK